MTSKPPDFVTGPLGAGDLNGAINWGRPLVARKTADTSRASTTSVADDPELFLSVGANAVYEICLYLICQADPAGDLKITWFTPSGSTLKWSLGSLGNGAAGPDTTVYQGLSTNASVEIIGGTSSNVVCRINGLLATTLAGTLLLRWAQGTSNATASIVRADSTLIAYALI